MDDDPMLLLSRPILDTANPDNEFNPYDLIEEHPETYIHANAETFLDRQSICTSPESTVIKSGSFSAGILQHMQHCAIPFAVTAFPAKYAGGGIYWIM